MKETSDIKDAIIDEPYSSLMALREVHIRLLKEYRQHQGVDNEFTQRLKEFRNRTRKTGTVLNDESEREIAQQALDHWATVLYEEGESTLAVRIDDFDLERAPYLPDDVRPYVGLDAFTETTTEIFFGRKAFVAYLRNFLVDNRLLVVIGPSGSGKSSVVRAGLIPSLKDQPLPGSNDWSFVGPIVPGSQPLSALQNALSKEKSRPPYIVIVDQFEEVFTLCNDDDIRSIFIDKIIHLIKDESAQNRVVLMMRSDYDSYVTRFSALQLLWEEAKIFLPPLSAGELREAIEKPAEQIGLKFETGLVDLLIADILGEPTALPLLQFTLLKLWERRNRNLVNIEIFRQLGGARQALANSADTLYDSLMYQEQVELRRILLRMVRPGRGLEVTSNRIRLSDLYTQAPEDRDRTNKVLKKLLAARLVRLTEQQMVSDAQIEVAHEALVRNWPTLVDWLADERTNLRDRRRFSDAAEQWERRNRDSEALLRGILLSEAKNYGDLTELEREFIATSSKAALDAEQEREEIRIQQYELQQARALAKEKAKAVRNSRYLVIALTALLVVVTFALWQAWSGEALRAAAERERNANATAQAAATEAVSQRSTAEVSATEAVSQQRTAEVAATVAVSQQSTAEAESMRAAVAAAEAEAQRIAFAARVQGEGSETGLLLAYESLSRDTSTSIAQTLRDLLEQETGVSGFIIDQSDKPQLNVEVDEVNSQFFISSQDGISLLTYGLGGSAAFSISLDVQSGSIGHIAVSSNGQYIGTIAINDNVVRIWNRQGVLLHRLVHRRAATSISFSPDNRYIITGSLEPGATIWEMSSGMIVHDLERAHDASPVFGVDISPPVTSEIMVISPQIIPITETNTSNSGASLAETTVITSTRSYIATASENSTVKLWDLETGAFVRQLSGHTGTVWDVEFSPDGRRLATASSDQQVYIWDVLTGELLIALPGHTGAVYRVDFDSTGERLVSASIDRTARVWDVRNGRLIAVLDGHTAALRDVAFGTSKNQVFTASDDGTIRSWILHTARPLPPLGGHTDWVRDAAYSPDGKTIVTASRDRRALRWDATTGNFLGEVANFSQEVLRVAFNNDGRYILFALGDGTARIWNAVEWKPIAILRGHSRPVWDAAFSPDGAWVATVSQDGSIQLWDVTSAIQTGEVQRQRADALTQDGTVWSVAFSSDSKSFVTASDDSTAIIWSVSSRSPDRILRIPGASVKSADFSPDGSKVVTGSTDQIVRIWDITRDVPPVEIEMRGHTGDIWDVEFSSNSEQVLSASSDQTARVWDVATGETLMVLRGHTGSVLSASFSRTNDFRVVTASVDGTARQHMTQIKDLLLEAACRVGRELTSQEIEVFRLPTPLVFDIDTRSCPPVFSWQ